MLDVARAIDDGDVDAQRRIAAVVLEASALVRESTGVRRVQGCKSAARVFVIVGAHPNLNVEIPFGQAVR